MTEKQYKSRKYSTINMIALPSWLLLESMILFSSLSTGADAARSMHAFDAWVTTPACPQTPLETDSKDSFDRLWGWDNNAKHSCAFKFDNQQPIVLDSDNQKQTWESASACLEAPTGDSSAPDMTWKLWGVYYGRQCAFKDALGQPIYYPAYAGTRFVPPAQVRTAPPVVPVPSPAAPSPLASKNSAMQKPATSRAQQQIAAQPPAGTAMPASSQSPATPQLPSSSKSVNPAPKPVPALPAPVPKPVVSPSPMPSPIVWVDVNLAKLQPQSATSPCTCNQSARVNATALAEALVEVLLKKLPSSAMSSVDADVKPSEAAAVKSSSSNFQASEEQRNAENINKPALAHFVTTAGTDGSSSDNRGAKSSTQQILANLLSAVTTADQDQQSPPINTPLIRPESGQPLPVMGEAGIVGGTVAGRAEGVHPTRPSDCLQDSCSISQKQQESTPAALPATRLAEVLKQQATAPASLP